MRKVIYYNDIDNWHNEYDINHIKMNLIISNKYMNNSPTYKQNITMSVQRLE